MLLLEKGDTNILAAEKVTIGCGETQVGKCVEEIHRKKDGTSFGVQLQARGP